MKRSIILLIAFLAFTSELFSQGINVPPRRIIDFPNGALLPKGSFDVTLHAFPKGGLVTGIDVGLHNRLMIGVSYGGTNVIGEGDVNWHPFAGANVRYRVIGESFTWPGVAVGFDSQGHGAYLDTTNRFERKALGFYAVSSKNYQILGGLGIHFGANYSLETDDLDKGINLFTGADLTIRPNVAVMAEYDFALNDNGDLSLGSGKGYLNAGLRFTIKDAVYLELFLVDLLENRENNFQRSIKVTYLEFFSL